MRCARAVSLEIVHMRTLWLLARSRVFSPFDQAVRDDLEQLAGGQQVAAEVSAFEQSALSTPRRLNGWRFDRNEAKCRGA
jgi:hypothetical protein